MTSLDGLPVLSVTELRAAEASAIASGLSVFAMMERAGAGVAQWAARLGGGADVLVLCGRGTNGGDGYVAARSLRERGVPVRVAALGDPRAGAARTAAAAWAGPVEGIDDAEPAAVVIDALLGTGADRPLHVPAATALIRAARLSLAVDLPSGIDADSGKAIGDVAECDVTLALGALKPAHLLQPGARLCGAVRLVDIGIDAAGDTRMLSRPLLTIPGPADHKYTRGMVAVVAGAMPGAAALAATAALRSGAGYVALVGDSEPGGPAALVRRPYSVEMLADRRVGCVLIGPGLGRNDEARAKLATTLGAGRSLVLDGDALHLLKVDQIPAGSILTPHAGEFDALFGAGDASKLERTRNAARRSGAVVVHKGPDTIIAAPAGRAVIAPAGSAWLATAGTGDVLAGAIAAQRASGLEPFAAAQAGVWLHARAAASLGNAFIADDLATALGLARS